MLIHQHPSPNFGPRRGGATPSLIVLHYTAMETPQAALARLCDPGPEVSAHYLICEAGVVYQLVEEEDRAWHAGAGAWGDIADVNSHSIGIELANRGPQSETPEFPAAQMASLIGLLREISARWAVPPARIIGHSDMAPGRKVDPGPCFDWQLLAKNGLSVWPDGSDPGDIDQFQTLCEIFGYRAPKGDFALVLDAFRLRFNPTGSGPVTVQEAGMAAELAARWPCKTLTPPPDRA